MDKNLSVQEIKKRCDCHEELVDIVKTVLGQIEEGIPFHATSNNENLLKQALALAKAGA